MLSRQSRGTRETSARRARVAPAALLLLLLVGMRLLLLCISSVAAGQTPRAPSLDASEHRRQRRSLAMLRNASKVYRGGKPWGAKGRDGRDAHSFGAGGTGGGGDESYIVGGVPLTFQESSAATEPTAPSTTAPSTTTALGAFSLFFVISALAATGGIGGGALYVPLLSLALQLPPQTSVGLSQGMIFGSALGALAVNAPTRHPLAPRRPLIDLGIASLLAMREVAEMVRDQPRRWTG